MPRYKNCFMVHGTKLTFGVDEQNYLFKMFKFILDRGTE